MSTYILTSMFEKGFYEKNKEVLQRLITKKTNFAFVASEFKKNTEITDKYFHFFYNMFEDAGMHFENAYVVDGRMSAKEAKDAVAKADVVWLSGGDTPTQFAYFKEFELEEVIRNHKGIIIGMSAGAINLTKTAICNISCGHVKHEIYPALGCVDICVEPHFEPENASDEVLEMSKQYEIFGMCDESMIVYEAGSYEYYGEIYRIKDGKVFPFCE